MSSQFTSEEKTYRWRVTAVSVILFVLLFVVYFIYHQNTQLIAFDNTTMFPIMIDFFNGNYLMKNWIVSTSSFMFTDNVWFIPGLLLGVHVPTLMSFCGALFHAGFVAIMLYLILRDEKKHMAGTLYAVIVAALYLMLFAVIPCAGYTMENPLYLYLNLNEHAGTFLFVIVEILLLYLWRDSQYKRKIYPILFTVYGLLGQMSDSMPLMVFFGPLCVYCAYFLIWPNVERNRKKDMFLIADSVLIVVLSSLINKIVSYYGGLTILGVSMGVNSPHQIAVNIKTVMIKMLLLFGYDTKYGISITPYVVIVCLIIGLIAVSVLYQIILAIKSGPDRLGLLLSLGIISNLIGIICIDTGGDAASRYILTVPFFGTALVVKFAASFGSRFKISGRCLLGFMLIISVGYSVKNITELAKVPNYGKDGEALAQYLEQRHVSVGYGGYWVSTVISSYTDFDTLIVPVRWDGEGVGFYHRDVLVNTEWYENRDIHYLVIQSDEGDLYSYDARRSDFIKFAGEPDEDVVFGIYEVLYYERDLSVYSITNAMNSGTDIYEIINAG